MNKVTSGSYGITGTTGATKPIKQTASQKTAESMQTEQTSKSDTIQTGIRTSDSVTYTRQAKKNTASADIAALKAEVDKSTENLRRLVKELILKQNKNYKDAEEDPADTALAQSGIFSTDIDAAREAISENGEYGVKAVSDRLVDFAIKVSGGDKSKLSMLVSAIDKGFAAARDTLGGELPEICQQTYDETMKKLNDWANQSDTEEPSA